MELRIGEWDEPAKLRLAAKFLMELAAHGDGETPTVQPIEDTSAIEGEFKGEVWVAVPDAPIGSMPPTEQEVTPRKRGRPRKNAEAAQPQPTTPAPEAPPVVAVTPATIDDAKAALSKVLDKAGGGTKGMDACRAIVKQFGVTKLTDIPAEKYDDFVQACEAAVK